MNLHAISLDPICAICFWPYTMSGSSDSMSIVGARDGVILNAVRFLPAQ
jgi:hypothetical protein